MEAECKSGDHDDKDDGNCTEGEDDILEEYNVLPNSVEKSQVEEEVDPGKGDGDSGDLPVEARTHGGCHEES